MAVLFLETASFGPSVAYGVDGEIRWDRVPKGRGQDLLMPTIHRLTDGAYDAIDQIVVTTGPGSFTGLRGGFAAAKGLAFPRRTPILGIDLFDVTYGCYQRYGGDGSMCLIALDAGRSEVFARLYTSSATHTAPHRDRIYNETPTALAARMPNTCPIVGSAASLFIQNPVGGQDRSILPLHPTAHDVALLYQADQKQMGSFHHNPTPFYVRPPDISQPKS